LYASVTGKIQQKLSALLSEHGNGRDRTVRRSATHRSSTAALAKVWGQALDRSADAPI
jgi:hypothetical protein